MKRNDFIKALAKKFKMQHKDAVLILDFLEQIGMQPPPLKRRGWTTWVVNEWSDSDEPETK